MWHKYKKDDGRSCRPRFAKDFFNCFFTFAHKFIEQLPVFGKLEKMIQKKKKRIMHIFTSGPFTAKKLRPTSVANALAIKVLLQPGGP